MNLITTTKWRVVKGKNLNFARLKYWRSKVTAQHNMIPVYMIVPHTMTANTGGDLGRPTQCNFAGNRLAICSESNHRYRVGHVDIYNAILKVINVSRIQYRLEVEQTSWTQYGEYPWNP